jgi:hypothetical protein
MRPKPIRPKDRKTAKQRLDRAEAVEHADWVSDCRRREQAKTPESTARVALAAKFAARVQK